MKGRVWRHTWASGNARTLGVLIAALATFSLGMSSRLYAQPGAATPAVADAGKLERARLKAIQIAVDTNAKSLESIRRESRQLSASLPELESRLVDLDKSQGALVREIKSLTDARVGVELDLQAISQKIAQQQTRLKARLRAAVLHGGLDGGLELLKVLVLPWNRSSQFEPGASTFLLGKIRKFDSDVLEGLLTSKFQHQELEKEIARLEGEQRRRRDELEREQSESRAKKVEIERTRSELKIREGQVQKLLGGLKAEAAKLEDVLEALTAQQSKPEEVAPLPPTNLPESKVTLGVPDLVVVPNRTWRAEGLEGWRGHLPLPITAPLIRVFGKQRFSDFADLVFQRGVEFGLGGDRTVRAVAPGKVMYLGDMPGYGHVVILDHGERYYTVYGRLGVSTVVAGQVVGGGEPLGLAGEADAQGRCLYFEIRKNGKPQDPHPYFARQTS